MKRPICNFEQICDVVVKWRGKVKQLLLRISLESFMILATLGVFVYYVIQKKPLIKDNIGKGDIVLKIASAICLGIVIWNTIIPFVRDIPNIVKNRYFIIEGVAEYKDKGMGASRTVSIKNEETKEEVRVDFAYNKGIEKDDWLVTVFAMFSLWYSC